MFGERKVMRWTDKKGNQVSLSTQHKDLYIVSCKDGGWYSVQSSEAIMMASHEPLVNTIKY